ncbi:MAG: D-alanine--D-alanine ligase [Candidatus Brocadiaceae bacterium]|nr:D-alanine--D-alanine ligase [Candidatus Brocadiaceae bacterium]
MSIGLVYDLRSDYLAMGWSEEEVAEFDSDETIDALADALTALGHDVERVGHARALVRRLCDGRRWDLVFNIAEGRHGRCREAVVPALLELYEVPCTFSDPLVCAMTLDKAVAKRVVASAGLATPRFHVVAGEDDLPDVDLAYPLFAKPLAEGTGKGIDGSSRIETRERLEQVCRRLLARYRQPVIVEEYLPGREFTTGILGTGRDARILGTMEVCIRPDAPESDYSREMKERCKEFVDYRPLEASALRDELEALALGAYRVLEVRDAGRLDFRLDSRGRPAFLEANPLPGLHPTHSDLPMIATQEGMSFVRLIGEIVESATTRVGSGAGGDHARP